MTEFRSLRRLMVGLLLIVACASSGDPSSTTSTTSQPGNTTSTTAGPNAVADACVVGSWILDLDSFVASFEATLRATGRTPDVSVSSGSAAITFEENGQVAGIFEDLTVQTDFGEDSVPIDTVLTGAIIGTWSVQEGTLVLAPDSELTTFEALTTLTVTPSSDSDVFYGEVPAEFSVVGRSFPLPIMSTGSTSTTRSIITCEGDTLTIGLERGRSATVWNRS
jgi:hypothetical protein